MWLCMELVCRFFVDVFPSPVCPSIIFVIHKLNVPPPGVQEEGTSMLQQFLFFFFAKMKITTIACNPCWLTRFAFLFKDLKRKLYANV